MNRFLGVFVVCGIVSAMSFGEEYYLSSLLSPAVKADFKVQEIEAGIVKASTVRSDALASFQPSLGGSFQANYVSQLPEMPPIPPTGASRALGTNDSYAAALDAGILVFDGFSRKHLLELSSAGLSAARLDSDIRKEEVKFQVVQAALRYELARLSLETIEASLVRTELNKQRVASFRAQGLASELDSLEIEGKLDELEMSKIHEENQLESSLITLRSLSGIENIDHVIIDKDYMQTPLDGISEVSASMLLDTPRLKALDVALSRARISKKMHSSDFYPSVRAFGSLNYGKPGADYFSDEWQFYYRGGVQVSFDLWSGGTRRNIQKRDAAGISALEASKHRVLEEILTQCRVLASRVDSLSDQYLSAQALNRGRREKYELIQKLWKAGQKSTLDVLAAEQELTQSDLILKKLEIQRAAGYQQLLQLLDLPLWNDEAGIDNSVKRGLENEK